MTKPLTDAEIAEMRKSGWYWVKTKNFYPEIWRTAFYDAEAKIWTCAGVRDAYYDSDFDEIGPRIPSPEELVAQRAMLKKLAGEHTAGCASLAARKFWEYGELEPCNLQCDCPCGEIAKMLGGE